MITFNRGLDDEFVNGLNNEYIKGGWWRTFLEDRELFVAIRDNRVNVYHRGCSLAELRWRDGAIVGRTHYKYLLRPSMPFPYVDFSDGMYDLDDPRSLFLESPKAVEELKKAARAYAGEEKMGVHKIIKANPNILDVEVAFGSAKSEKTDRSAPRVDFAALQVSDESLEIMFFEAKHFANPELRVREGNQPKVVQQMAKYQRLLEKCRETVYESYRRVCDNLLRLNGVAERHEERHNMLEYIVERPLTINDSPRLVVFGFDEDQKRGDVWKRHRQRLIDKLGKKRVLLKGDSKDFRRGISI